MMSLTIVTVAYRLRVPVVAFRDHAREVAERIAAAPGLVWKIWGLDEATGEGTSVYLFRDVASADAFAEGPVLAELRDGPADRVTVRLAPVVRDLSEITRAAAALA
ncbi:MAG: YdhR family protein [Amaricoccus sp.]